MMEDLLKYLVFLLKNILDLDHMPLNYDWGKYQLNSHFQQMVQLNKHSLEQIEQICERSLWICEGRIRADGSPNEVHPAYMEHMMKKKR